MKFRCVQCYVQKETLISNISITFYTQVTSWNKVWHNNNIFLRISTTQNFGQPT